MIAIFHSFLLVLGGCGPPNEGGDSSDTAEGTAQHYGLNGYEAFEPASVLAVSSGERLYVYAADPAATCASLASTAESGVMPPGRGFWLQGDAASGCDASTDCAVGDLTFPTGQIWNLTEEGNPFEGDGALFYGGGTAAVTSSQGAEGGKVVATFELACYDTYCPNEDSLSGTLEAENCGTLP